MTRAVLGLIALDAGYLALGGTILFGLGLLRRPRDVFFLAGLSFFLGWALTGVFWALALAAGIDLTVAATVVVWALAAGAAVVAALVVPGPPLRLRGERRGPGLALAVAATGLLVAVLVQLLRRTLASGAFQPDAWGFWLPKPMTIYWFGGLDTGPGGFTSFESPDYPPASPAQEALAWRFMGRQDPLLLPVQHWVIFVAFLAAVGALLLVRARPAIVAPLLALVAMLPALDDLVGSSLGDEPLALLFAAAVVCGSLWLLERDWRLAALAATFLSTGALTKNEGLMLAAAFSIALAAAAFERRRRWLIVVAVGAAPVLAHELWQLWLSANHVPGNAGYKLSDVLRFGYLGDRSDRVWPSIRQLVHFLFFTPQWSIVTPLALVAAVAVARRRPRLAGFLVGTTVLATLGYMVIYWIKPVRPGLLRVDLRGARRRADRARARRGIAADAGRGACAYRGRRRNRTAFQRAISQPLRRLRSAATGRPRKRPVTRATAGPPYCCVHIASFGTGAKGARRAPRRRQASAAPGRVPPGGTQRSVQATERPPRPAGQTVTRRSVAGAARASTTAATATIPPSIAVGSARGHDRHPRRHDLDGRARPGAPQRADLLIEEGAVAAIEPAHAGGADVEIDAEGCIVVPGLVNCHTHAGCTPPARGVAEDLDLPEAGAFYHSVVPLLYLFYDRVTRDEFEAIMEWDAIAMLLGGATTVVEENFGGADVWIELVGRLGFRSSLGLTYPGNVTAIGFVQDGKVVRDDPGDVAAGSPAGSRCTTPTTATTGAGCASTSPRTRATPCRRTSSARRSASPASAA